MHSGPPVVCSCQQPANDYTFSGPPWGLPHPGPLARGSGGASIQDADPSRATGPKTARPEPHIRLHEFPEQSVSHSTRAP